MATTTTAHYNYCAVVRKVLKGGKVSRLWQTWSKSGRYFVLWTWNAVAFRCSEVIHVMMRWHLSLSRQEIHEREMRMRGMKRKTKRKLRCVCCEERETHKPMDSLWFTCVLSRKEKKGRKKRKKSPWLQQLIYFYALKYIRYREKRDSACESCERRDSHLDLDDGRFPRAQLLMNMDLFLCIQGRKSHIQRGVTLKNGSPFSLHFLRNDLLPWFVFYTDNFPP